MNRDDQISGKTGERERVFREFPTRIPGFMSWLWDLPMADLKSKHGSACVFRDKRVLQA